MAQHLVVVCCHAVFHGGTLSPRHETNWSLKSFQRSTPTRPAEHEIFLEHVNEAFAIKDKQPHSTTLVFSGGPTDSSYPALSESQSYLDTVAARKSDILLEELATDSFQNLLFSIITFRKHYGQYPDEITIITHAFKEARFLELHATAIHWPLDRIRVRGMNPPFTQNELTQTIASEHQNGYIPWERDPYGTGLFLAAKRKDRRWSEDAIDTLIIGLEDVVQRLLRWKGGDSSVTIFPHRLPWED